MNALASILVWLSVQVAVFSLVGSGLFLLVRRRGPRAAATCTAIVLGLTLALAVLAISPWPRWTLELSRRQAPAAPVLKAAATPNSTSMPAFTAEDIDVSQSTIVAGWWNSAIDWLRSAGAASDSDIKTPPAWRTWLPIALCIGIGFCLVRLAIGIWAVRRLRMDSIAIHDEGLIATLREIVSAMGATAGSSSSGTSTACDPLTAGQASSGTPMVEIRESRLLRSAATIGWRKPLLLLPADWRSWTETERRAVLAHELAHIARRDYATGLVARLATAIHFYQPLVLWLNRQLRIQQELAADSQAAILSGDRQTYLTTLAQMALRADEQPLPWAARAFLPGTSSLIKRVTWLKRKGNPMEKSLSRTGRWMLVAVTAAIALAVAGIRGPTDTGSSIAKAEPPAKDENPPQLPAQLVEIRGVIAADPNNPNAPPKPFNGKLTIQGDGGKLTVTNGSGALTADTITLQGVGTLVLTGAITGDALRTFDFIPADAKLVVAISPNTLFKLPSLAKLAPMMDEIDKQNKFGVKSTDLADVVLVKTGTAKKFDRLILRNSKPFDWKAVLQKSLPGLETKSFEGKEFFLVKQAPGELWSGPWGDCFYIPDDRTLIVGTDEEIQKIFHGGEKLMTAETFPSLPNSPIAVRGDMTLMREMMGLDKKQLDKQLNSNPLLALFLPLLEQTKIVTFSGNATSEAGGKDRGTFGLSVECGSPEAAQTVAKTLEAVRTFAVNGLAAKKGALHEEAGKAFNADMLAAADDFVVTISKALADIQIRTDGNTATASTNVDIAPPAMGAFLMPALAASREAAMRNESMLNLKQLSLGCLMDEDKHRYFPTNIRDKNGNPLLSWRVAILPNLGGEAATLFSQFHRDEPWDSEHNKPLIDKMPAVFRDPHEDDKTTNSSYFMITGKGTIGEAEKGTKIDDIKDGTAKTIMLVEAKRDIPWTKPEDIEIDADPTKPLPKFGGHMPNGLWAAAFADGHVEAIAESVDPKLLRAMFTIAGGETTDGAALNRRVEEKPAAEKPKPAPGDSGQDRVKLELHRAETEPGEGLTESAVMGRSEKIYLHPDAEITNDDIKGASVTTDAAGKPVISVAFSADGAKKMAAISKAHLKKPLAIMLDGRVVMAPTIQSEMSGGVQITGNLTPDAAQRIADGLNGK